jgi:cytochrome c oxidase subunit 2
VRVWSSIFGAGIGGLALAAAGTAMAAGTGQPEPWQIAMQTPVTPLAAEAHSFHTLLMWLITLITVFVAGLIGYCMFRFNEKANPTPSKTAHNTAIEIAWTVVPVLILVLIAIPSFRLLRGQLIIPPADITIKAVGNSWFWGYEYQGDKEGKGGFKFDANLVEEKDLKPGQVRLLSTDNDVVVPINKVVRLQTTSADVLHSWGVPSLGFTMDAVPGRLNEIWFKIDREGVFHGQCRELCGQRHAYMPITVRAVSEAEYDKWVAEARTKFASTDPVPTGPARKLADAARN